MKKTIQITIAGFIFNIEEDAYETLSSYLNSVQKYFTTYEGSEEIYADIEARVAEKFIGSNKMDDLPIITADAVEKVTASMGTVSDFEALEEEEDFVTNAAEENTQESESSEKPKEKKRLFRDTKRKALGGVLSGLANHFNVDVVWFRVIFLVGFLGLAESGIGGFFFLAYIICWIAFPANENLAEQDNLKKFYRDPSNKVVAGVASGLASYFNIDIALVRILFVLSIFFFGVGLVAYLVLWVASPIAASLTQKMEMKGEAVTIENIDSNIKQKLNEATDTLISKKNENALATILLLPFRIIAKIFQAIGTVLGKLGPLFRVLLGLVPLLWGAAMFMGALAATVVYFAGSTGNAWFIDDSNFQIFARDWPPTAGIFIFLTTALPAIALFLLGLFLITNKRIGDRGFWITGLGLWLIGVVGIAIFGSTYGMNYAKEGTVRSTDTFELVGETLYLESLDNYNDEGFDIHGQVRIERASGNEITLEKRLTARGRNREDARKNAQNIDLNVHQNDSVLVFDERITLTEGSRYRGQDVYMTLRVPSGQKIHMSNGFADAILANDWDLRRKYGISNSDFGKLSFMINSDGELICEGCEELSEDEQNAYRDRVYGYNSFSDDDEEFRARGNYDRSFNDLSDFKSIEVGGAFRVLVKQGDEFSVEFTGERERDIEDLRVRVRNGELDIDFNDRFFKNRRRVNAFITMPDLNGLDVGGAVKLKVLAFEDINRLSVELGGASQMKLDIEADAMDVNASGASTLELMGIVNSVDVDISGASHFKAEHAEINRATVEASGASNAYFGDVGNLNSETSGASHVTRD